MIRNSTSITMSLNQTLMMVRVRVKIKKATREGRKRRKRKRRKKRRRESKKRSKRESRKRRKRRRRRKRKRERRKRTRRKKMRKKLIQITRLLKLSLLNTTKTVMENSTEENTELSKSNSTGMPSPNSHTHTLLTETPLKLPELCTRKRAAPSVIISKQTELLLEMFITKPTPSIEQLAKKLMLSTGRLSTTPEQK